MDNITAPAKLTKKEMRLKIQNKLAEALGDFRTGMKDKRFESNLKKASRLFADEYVKEMTKLQKKISKKMAKKNK